MQHSPPASSPVVSRYGLKVAATKFFRGESYGQPQCLFISGECAIPAQLYPGDSFEGSESQFPSSDDYDDYGDGAFSFPVDQMLSRLCQDYVSRNHRAMLDLSQRVMDRRRVNRHPPTVTSPAKKAELLRQEIKHASLDLLLA